MSKSKRCEHLASLISELTVYERELGHRVREKEAELGQLLLQLRDGGNTFKPAVAGGFLEESPSASQPHTLSSLKMVPRGDLALSLSPSLPSTRERQFLRPPGRLFEKEQVASGESSSAPGISGLSPITQACESFSDVESPSMEELLLAIEEAVGLREERHVRFSFHGIAASQEPTNYGPSRTSHNRKEVWSRTTVPLHSDCITTCLASSITENSSILKDQDNTKEDQFQLASDGATDGVARDSRAASASLSPVWRKAQRPLERKSSLTNNEVTECAILSADTQNQTMLPRGRCARKAARREETEVHQYRSTMYKHGSASRSTSAAHTRPTTVTQEEGRCAGIVLACGPTLYFD
ncbi:hypothetical protein ERJ75_001822500 [Trypanosoma vivax]|uniref:Uncharacterized protein n=1 Tax=Trypanosoma vivax (strain Y486) TaxID=1055687 RepID=F9WVP3_TRYVY|nr:hypothetical protein ERJ75_001822500 [Trypanosoma vivax]CCD21651.1 hypothetical protein, conserved [Trypanosoma vivax Y486]|eukprot:CCD21651.1 hypothetical protein, conserved [Trypanosoma vivax Y486]